LQPGALVIVTRALVTRHFRPDATEFLLELG